MSGLRQVWRVACYEWFDALRSRRAIVVLLLYMAAAMWSTNWSINALHKLEVEVAATFQLQESGRTGVVSTALWKSEPFKRMMRRLVQSTQVYEDIEGRHPAELVYALFAFLYAPLLVVLVAAGRVAEDLGSGAVRYVVMRVPRVAWSLGKLLGQVMMVGLALALSGMCAYGVIRYRLAGTEMAGMLAGVLGWSMRAWLFSFPYLGLALGLSHLTRSASKAIIMGLVAIAACFVCSLLLKHFTAENGWRALLPQVALLLPGTHEFMLWRRAAAPLATGAAWLVALGMSYFMAGVAVFGRRDV